MEDLIVWLVLLLLLLSCCFSCECFAYRLSLRIKGTAAAGADGKVEVQRRRGSEEVKGGDESTDSDAEDEPINTNSIGLRLSTRRVRGHPLCNYPMFYCKLVSAFVGSYVLVLMFVRFFLGAFETGLLFPATPGTDCVESCDTAYCCTYTEA